MIQAMHLTWHGQYTVKLVSKETTVVLDPYAPSVGLPPFRSKADIVALTSPANEEMCHLEGIQGEPTVVATPGEYSLRGVTLHAVAWRAEDGSERSLQLWNIEGMSLLHLGALERPLSDEELQVLERRGIDVLLVPVGGGSSLNTTQALDLVRTVEPRIVIPIHFKLPKLKESLEPVDQFAKEMGVSASAKEKKLLLKSNRLPQEDIETVILAP